jgi:hypothetical protein
MEVTRLNATTSPAAGVDPGTGSTGVLLVDCTANDGACLDTIYLIQRVANDVSPVNLYISSSAHALGVTATGGSANANFIGRVAFAAAQKEGAYVEAVLPKLLAPVPHAGANNEAGEPAQFRGLYLQAGQALWAAVASASAVANAPNIACQGGYY